MSEEYLIRHCAPTLAGLKTGSLFTCPYGEQEEIHRSLCSLNRRLRGKGLRAVPLRFSEKNALIYLYRPRKLSRDMADQQAEQLLRSRGYETGSCDHCVAQLRRRLAQQKDFPHEIGLFLGYPVEDVRGFMEQGPDKCKCVGCWKVYGDPEAAEKVFQQYRKCSRVYREQWAQGKDIERLTVAG